MRSTISAFLAAVLLISTPALAQTVGGNPAAPTSIISGGPTVGASCVSGAAAIDSPATGNQFVCVAGTWTQATRSIVQQQNVGNQVGINYQNPFYKQGGSFATTASSTAVTTSAAYFFVYAGMPVTDSGSCIPAGTTYFPITSTSGTLSQAASGTCAADTFTFYYPFQAQLQPIVNETGQTITDPVFCWGGGNGQGGFANAEFAAQNELIQASYMTSPFGQATAVPLVFPAGTTGTIFPGDLASGCAKAAGVEIASGATAWLSTLATVPSPATPSTQLLSMNRTVSLQSGALTGTGGVNVPAIPTAFSPAVVAPTSATTASGSTLTFAALPPYVSTVGASFYVSSGTASIPFGAKVSTVNSAAGTVTMTAAVSSSVVSATNITFSLYEAWVSPSGTVSSGATTIPVTTCPVGVGSGFNATGTGMPVNEIVVSCSGTTLTLAAPITAGLTTASVINFSAYNNGSINSFNPASMQGNVQSRVLSFLDAADSEVAVAGIAYVTTTTTAAFNPTSCVNNTATLSVNQTSNSGYNLVAGTSPVNLYLANIGAALVIPYTLTPLAAGTQLVGVNAAAGTITVSPCPLYTVPISTALNWGTSSISPNNDIGWLEGSLQGYPVSSLARSGDSYSLWVNDRALRTKIAGLSGYTDFLSMMCDNDLQTDPPAGQTIATTLPYYQAMYQSIWSAMTARGMRVRQATCVPRSTGSYLGEPTFSNIVVTNGGTGYTASTPFTTTVAGGTLAASPLNLPTLLTCTPNSSGVVPAGGCVVAATGGAGSGTPAIGYYSVTPTITGNTPTGGTGSGLTVTLNTYVSYQDPYSQTSAGTGFQPTVTTTVATAANNTTTLSVSANVNAGSPALPGQIATGMYISTLSGAPANTVVTAISGTGPYSLTLNNPVTFAQGATINIISLRTEFNDWIRTTPTPLKGYLDVAAQIEYGTDTDLWGNSMSADGLHAGTPTGQIALGSWMKGLVAGGTFMLP